jgi:ribonuclease J
MIPGNERAIGAVQDNLVRRGVQVMTDNDHMVHVSGHPARDEMRRLYRLVRPKFAVPVHGEWRHLAAHAALATELGVESVMMENGDILHMAPGKPEIVDSAPVGVLALDGNRVVPLQGGVMAARRKMLFNGLVLGSLAVDEAGRLMGRAKVSAPGLFEPDDPESERLARDFGNAVADLPAALRRDDVGLADAAKAALRRCLGKKIGKRPLVDVHLLRV